MKDYHFQEKEQDFGLTVRLDDINEKVCKEYSFFQNTLLMA